MSLQYAKIVVDVVVVIVDWLLLEELLELELLDELLLELELR